MHKAFLQLAAVLALSLVFLSTDLPNAECFSTTDAVVALGSSATRIADILPDDEEFMMESETGRRILVVKGSAITPKAQNPNKPYCKTNGKYEGCDGKQTGIKDRRKCDKQNLCDRS